MQSRWIDRDAQAAVDRYAKAGIARDLALRVYTTRLLGGDPKLVLHGGGNTSVKMRIADLAGEDTDVLCVKGTGADMAAIEPAGIPAVRLGALLKLRAQDDIADDRMVRLLRASLIDPGAPNPSVETLLHAFMPHKFVDHTHATALLSVIDQPDGEQRARDIYGEKLGIVPYRRPGFGLAKAAADTFDANPKAVGLVLHKHGIFTFGADAREAYETMIEMVTLAEAARADEPQVGVRRGATAAAYRAAGRGGAIASRRDQPPRWRNGRRVAAAGARISRRRRRAQFRQRQGRRALR